MRIRFRPQQEQQQQFIYLLPCSHVQRKNIEINQGYGPPEITKKLIWSGGQA